MNRRLDNLDPAAYTLPDALLGRVYTPALAIYMPQVRRNIQRILAYANGDVKRWRPHIKTTKTPEVYAELLRAGLRHFKCATLREARCLLREARALEVLSEVDLLIAYPLQGPALADAGELPQQFPGARLSVLSESPAHVRSIDASLDVFVDVNPGMNRTGIPLADPARILEVVGAAGSRFAGLHFYDGHVHDDTGDERRVTTHKLYASLLELRTQLLAQGFDCAELITSGTPTFKYALDFAEFLDLAGCQHRVSPGTVVFHDLQYDDLLEDLELEPAAVVLSRVISKPNDGLVTCDAGSKSVASEAGAPVAYVVGHPQLVAQSPSEEHLPLKVTGATGPDYGEVLLLVPKHVCPTVNLAEQALLVEEDGSATVVDVKARAHDLLRA